MWQRTGDAGSATFHPMLRRVLRDVRKGQESKRVDNVGKASFDRGHSKCWCPGVERKAPAGRETNAQWSEIGFVFVVLYQRGRHHLPTFKAVQNTLTLNAKLFLQEYSNHTFLLQNQE